MDSHLSNNDGKQVIEVSNELLDLTDSEARGAAIFWLTQTKAQLECEKIQDEQ